MAQARFHETFVKIGGVEVSTFDVHLKAFLEHLRSKIVPKAETFVKSCLLDIFVDPQICPKRGTFVKSWPLGEGKQPSTTAWMPKKRHPKSQISVLICFQRCPTRYTQNRRHSCSPLTRGRDRAIAEPSPSRRQAVDKPSTSRRRAVQRPNPPGPLEPNSL